MGSVCGLLSQGFSTIRCVSPIDRARILGSCAPHSGDWLNAMPGSSCGLFLSDEEVRTVSGSELVVSLTCMRVRRND